MTRFALLGFALLTSMFSHAPQHSPYSSALKPPAMEALAAASHCANKTCSSVGGGCIQAAGYFCAKSGGQCFTRACQ
jgi:hypothetical protein